jgi:zinc/manganese transport system substrate-binding protein
LKILLILAALIASLPARAETLKVVASFSILGDMVKQIGGDRVQVTTLVGRDADPHAFAPKPSDAGKLADARVLVVNGLGFDPWADRLAAATEFAGATLVASRQAAPLTEGYVVDPHAWQSIPNAMLYVDAIVEGLSAAAPDMAAAFHAGGDAYKERLRAVDGEIRADLAPIPQAARTLIVPHRALDYFGREYGVTFLAPVGIDADAEPGAGAVAALIQSVHAGRVQAILSEHLEQDRVIRRIAAESGLPVSGALYADALSATDGPAATYIDLMRFNAHLIAAALASPRAAPPPR